MGKRHHSHSQGARGSSPVWPVKSAANESYGATDNSHTVVFVKSRKFSAILTMFARRVVQRGGILGQCSPE